MNRDGQKWYKSHTESKYFPDFSIDADSLARDYPNIYQRYMDYWMNFLFEEPRHCNLSVVREFYANISKEPRTRRLLFEEWKWLLLHWP